MQISCDLTASKSGVSVDVNPKNQARYQHTEDVYPEYGFINQKELFWSKFLMMEAQFKDGLVAGDLNQFSGL